MAVFKYDPTGLIDVECNFQSAPECLKRLDEVAVRETKENDKDKLSASDAVILNKLRMRLASCCSCYSRLRELRVIDAEIVRERFGDVERNSVDALISVDEEGVSEFVALEFKMRCSSGGSCKSEGLNLKLNETRDRLETKVCGFPKGRISNVIFVLTNQIAFEAMRRKIYNWQKAFPSVRIYLMCPNELSQLRFSTGLSVNKTGIVQLHCQDAH